MKKYIKTFIILVVLIAIVIKARSVLLQTKEGIKQEPTALQSVVGVELVKPTYATLEKKVSFLATLQADKKVSISTKNTGYIKKVYVHETDYVKKGELLLEIDTKDVSADIKAVKSTLKMQISDMQVTQNIYERNKKLYDIGGISKEKLDISKVTLQTKKAKVTNTKAQLTKLYNQLSYLKIKAPFDGQVDRVLLHDGDLASISKPILTLNNQKQKLIFSYTQNNNINKGMQVIYKDKKIGTIKSIYPTSQNALNIAEVQLNTTLRLPLESKLNIEVITDKKDGCIIPNSTILHKKNNNYILSYKGDRFIPIKVDILLSSGDKKLIETCPDVKIAKASERKLSSLLVYDNIKIVGNLDE